MSPFGVASGMSALPVFEYENGSSEIGPVQAAVQRPILGVEADVGGTAVLSRDDFAKG